MSQAGSARRFLPVAIFICAWLAIGLAVPLLVGLIGPSRLVPHTTVEAAPRHEARIFQPFALDRSFGLWLNRGRVALQLEPGKELDLNGRDALIAKGAGNFAIRDAKLTFFSEPPPTRERHADEMPAPIIDGLRSRGYRTLKFEASKIVLGLPSGEPFILRDANATIEPRPDGGTRVRGNGNWFGSDVAFVIRTFGPPKPVDTEKTSADGAVAGKADSLSQVAMQTPATRQRLEISLKSDLFDFTFDGAIGKIGSDRTFSGTVDVRSEQAPSFISRIMPGIPGTRIPKDFTLVSTASWTGQGAQLDDVKLSLDRQSAVGTLGMVHRQPRPQLTGTLDFDVLDVAAFNMLQKASSVEVNSLQSLTAAAVRTWERLQSGFHTPIWRNVDVDLRLSAEKLLYGGTDLGRVAAAIALSNGLMKTHIVEFGFAGGVGTGQISIDFNNRDSAAAFRGRINDADGNRAISSLFGVPALSGPTHIKFDLTITEPEPNSVLRDALSGSLSIETPPDKSAVGLNLSKLLSVDTPTALAELHGSTPVQTAKAEFTFLNGRAYCRSGTIRLAERTFDVTGWFGLVSPEGDFVISERKPPEKSLKPNAPAEPLKSDARQQEQAADAAVRQRVERRVQRWRIVGKDNEFEVARHPTGQLGQTASPAN